MPRRGDSDRMLSHHKPSNQGYISTRIFSVKHLADAGVHRKYINFKVLTGLSYAKWTIFFENRGPFPRGTRTDADNRHSGSAYFHTEGDTGFVERVFYRLYRNGDFFNTHRPRERKGNTEKPGPRAFVKEPHGGVFQKCAAGCRRMGRHSGGTEKAQLNTCVLTITKGMLPD